MGMGVHLFDVASGKHLRQLDEGANEINISAVAWSPDGTQLALAGVNQQRNTGPIITLWDAATGDEIRKITGLPGAAAAAGPGAMNPWMMRRQQQNGPLECIAFAPDGKSLAVVMDRTHSPDRDGHRQSTRPGRHPPQRQTAIRRRNHPDDADARDEGLAARRHDGRLLHRFFAGWPHHRGRLLR